MSDKSEYQRRWREKNKEYHRKWREKNRQGECSRVSAYQKERTYKREAFKNLINNCCRSFKRNLEKKQYRKLLKYRLYEAYLKTIDDYYEMKLIFD